MMRRKTFVSSALLAASLLLVSFASCVETLPVSALSLDELTPRQKEILCAPNDGHDYGGVVQKMQDNDIERVGMNHLKIKGRDFVYHDFVRIGDVAASYLVVYCGPWDWTSSWRFIVHQLLFLPDYTSVELINLDTLEVVRTFKVRGHVECVILSGATLYLRFENGKYGKGG